MERNSETDLSLGYLWIEKQYEKDEHCNSYYVTGKQMV
jgi:hypothetical protein